MRSIVILVALFACKDKSAPAAQPTGAPAPTEPTTASGAPPTAEATAPSGTAPTAEPTAPSAAAPTAEPTASSGAAPAQPQAGAPAAGAPATGAPAWAKDGASFEGPSVGGRGGHYDYVLCANGTYSRNCLDAVCERGTWKLDGNTVVLSQETPDKKEERIPLSADGKTLGSSGPDALIYKGPPSKARCGG